MKLYSNGNEYEYNGHPTLKKLKAFIDQKTGPASSEITTDDTFNELEEQELALAYFGDNDEDFKTFERLVAGHEDIRAFHSFDSKFYNLNNQVRVTLYKKFDGGKVNFVQPFGEEALQKWLLLNR